MGLRLMEIRSFDEKDRENCREICHKTATAPEYVKSKELVCLLYCDYYLDNEPDNCFVLVDNDDNAIGYILCGEKQWAYEKAMKPYLKKVRRLSFKQWLSHAVEGLLDKSVAKKYPAHLHIDILPEGQRKGYGSKLIDTLESHLKEKGVKGIRLGVGGDNEGAHKFYEAKGYTLFRNYGRAGRVYVKSF
jgi:ribosomal protein S18 acetylase RimI-like enzyme